MEIKSYDYDDTSVRLAIQQVIEYFGSRWLDSQFASLKKARKGPIVTRKRTVVHPIVSWYEQYRKRSRRSGSIADDPALASAALQIVAFGQALGVAQTIPGFARLETKLRDPKEFRSAAFEVEVASFYQPYGWHVEFLEETEEKRPDLRLVTPDGDTEVFAECKCRDGMTERDRKIDAAWRELSDRLFRWMDNNSMSAGLEIEWLRDPIVEDLKRISEFTEAANRRAVLQRLPYGYQINATVDDAFNVNFARLSSGEWIPASGIRIRTAQENDHFQMISEAVSRDGKSKWRNPKYLAFRTKHPTDKVKSIVQSLKSATKQLPTGHPGVVWIRVPDNSWSKDYPGNFDRAEGLIRRRLAGRRNRRVNQVFVITRAFRKLEESLGNNLRRDGVGYGPLLKQIEHEDPAVVFPSFEKQQELTEV